MASVLFYNLSDAIGGLELITVNYFKLLSAQGMDVWFFCHKGTPIHRLVESYGSRVIATERKMAKFSFPLIKELRQAIAANNIDVVHAHTSRDIWLCSLAVMGRRQKLIYTCYNFIDHHYKKDLLHRVIYSRCNLITVFSKPQWEGFIKTHPVRRDQVQIVSNGVNLEVFRPQPVRRLQLRQELGYTEDDIVIGIVGRVMRDKGQWMLVELADELFGKCPQARILLVGGDTHGREDAYMTALREKAAQWVETGHIVFTGFTDDVASYLSAMDVFVLASRAENFGTALLEAMATGAACIGSDAGGTPEILDGGESGLLFEPESVVALKEALFTLVGDHQMLSHLKDAARQKAVSSYDINHIMDRWKDIYASIT